MPLYGNAFKEFVCAKPWQLGGNAPEIIPHRHDQLVLLGKAHVGVDHAEIAFGDFIGSQERPDAAGHKTTNSG